MKVKLIKIYMCQTRKKRAENKTIDEERQMNNINKDDNNEN